MRPALAWLIGMVVGSGLLLITATSGLAQIPVDTLRGRVVGSDSVSPISDAEVTARSVRTLEARSALTDADGRFVIVFPDTSPAYELRVRMLGWRTALLRVTRDASGQLGTPLVVLTEEAIAVEGINVQAKRPPASFPATGVPSLGATSRETRPNYYEVPPGEAGDLNVFGASELGATILTDPDGEVSGFSIGGAAPEQNSIVLDGTTFGSAKIPAFARNPFGIQATSATYDPARGGFSGGQVRAGLDTGADSPRQYFRLLIEDPALQFTGPTAADLGREYRDLTLQSQFQGPLLGKWRYSISTDVSWHTQPLSTLLDADAAALQSVGLAPDSVAQLGSTLGALGVPLTNPEIPSNLRTRGVNSMAYFTTNQFWDQTVTGIRLDGNWAEQAGLGLGSTALPAAGGRHVNSGGGAMLFLTHRNDSGFVTDTRSYFSVQRSKGEPYVDLPAADVRIASSFENGDGAVRTVRFGGNPQFPTDSRTRFWETVHKTSWRSYDDRHQYQLGAMLHANWFDETTAPNRLGTFSFNSLADLAAGRPSLYMRTLDTMPRRASTWRGAVSFGDVDWKVSDNARIEYGLRFEGARFGDLPSHDPAVDSLFGRRTDRFPSQFGLSPRFGFTWLPGNPYREGEDYRTRQWSDYPYQLKAGFGLFRDVIDPSFVALRGAATRARVLSCLGAAAPVPDWELYRRDPSAVPAACAEGPGTLTPFSGTAPSVSVFDPSFRASRAWKGNLSWRGWVRGILRYTLDARYTRGVTEQSTIDLNLRPSPAFALEAEGGRPVFSPLEAFDPATGVASPLASRRFTDFGTVTNLLSDAQREAWEFSVRLQPWWSWGRAMYTLDYTYARMRDQLRGTYGGVTSGDPRVLEWGRSAFERRHKFQLTGQFALGPTDDHGRRSHLLTLRARLYSGTPFTPLVQGDVNGDGSAFNDAAFIFDPATASDPVAAAGMRDLLEVAPSGVRECLGRQFGRIATRNSCTGPWTVQLDAEYRLPIPGLKYLLPIFRGDPFDETGGIHVILRAENLLGGLDQLLHGSDGLKGWGSTGYVDPVLLSVDGFDPRTRRFEYDVNTRFGRSPAEMAGLGAPFRFVVEVNFSRAANVSKRQVDYLRRNLDKPGQKFSQAEIEEIAPWSNSSNLIDWFLDRTDILLLTDEQVRVIEAIRDEFNAERDSLVVAPQRAYLRTVTSDTPWEEVHRTLYWDEDERTHAGLMEKHEQLEGRYLLRIKQVLAPDQWALTSHVQQRMAAQAEEQEQESDPTGSS